VPMDCCGFKCCSAARESGIYVCAILHQHLHNLDMA
jgi:hypothetical protein